MFINVQSGKIKIFKQIIRTLNSDPESAQMVKEKMKEGREWAKHQEFVWEGILRSMSTMGDAGGFERLILNYTNYKKVMWSAVKETPSKQLKEHFYTVLKDARVRDQSGKKSQWLTVNRDKIVREYGDAKKCSIVAATLVGKDAKMAFVESFEGIGNKYKRNFWMDLVDPDFKDCIAIDSRIEEISETIGLPKELGENCETHENFYLGVARELNMTGWRLDRLMFNFKNKIVQRLRHA